MAVMLPGPAHAGPWRPAHVVVVIEENHGYKQIIGNPDAAFINELAADGALLTNSHGLLHPSQPNYLALFSGSIQGVTDDRPVLGTPLTDPNLGAALIAKGHTFAGYSEGLPAIGSLSLSVGDAYAFGLVIGFALNRRWTFASARRSPAAQLQYVAAFAFSYALNICVVLGARACCLDRLAAQALGIPVYTASFFLVCHYVVFRDVRRTP